MEHRPTQYYDKCLRLDSPTDSEKKVLLRRFKRGGLKKMDEEGLRKLGLMPLRNKSIIVFRDKKKVDFDGTLGGLKKAVDDTIGKVPSWALPGSVVEWIYVGDLWWCRKVNSEFEFARYVAVTRISGKEDLHGLWNKQIHEFKAPPVIVYKGGEEGVVIGYNSNGLSVKFKGGFTNIPFSDVTFKYQEDYDKYRRLFTKITSSG